VWKNRGGGGEFSGGLSKKSNFPLDSAAQKSSCRIEDGNYADICVGERRKFALEFWVSSPLIRSAENVYSSC
jgi:hypothetical protein